MKSNPSDEEMNIIRAVAITNFVWDQREQFVEYLISESSTTICADALSLETAHDATFVLINEGFAMPDDTECVYFFAHPDQYHELCDELITTGRLAANAWPEKYHDGISAYDARFFADATVPRGRAICVHRDAIMPQVPGLRSFRPWLVRDGRGVVVIEIESASNRQDTSTDPP